LALLPLGRAPSSELCRCPADVSAHPPLIFQHMQIMHGH